MACNHAARPGECDHLLDNTLGLGDVDQDETGMHEIERVSRQPGRLRVTLQDLDIGASRLDDEPPGERGEVPVLLNPDHPAAGSDSLGEQTKNPLQPAAQVDRTRAGSDLELVEEPARLGLELANLPAKAVLLNGAVPEQVRIGIRHSGAPR
jgi:hypothetical protein